VLYWVWYNATKLKGEKPHLAWDVNICEYEPDFRQAIADSWPRTIDDSAACEEWGWEPSYDLAAMTADMLEKLGQRIGSG